MVGFLWLIVAVSNYTGIVAFEYSIRQHARASVSETLFGSSIALASDGTALISNQRYDNDVGRAHIFQKVELERGVAWPNST
ncbi:MAG: hypothetical protein VXW24_05770, partial [Bacteroidota bacterium]|nr:hypothetical protein [Bacteroidota bacterium]